MGFCPVCKSEYKEGITVCHDCKVPLVDDLSKGPTAIMYGEEEELNAILDHCRQNGMKSGFVSFHEESGNHQLYFGQDEMQDAVKLIQAYMAKRAIQSMADAEGIDPKDLTPEKIREIQEKAKKEAEEARDRARYGDKDAYIDKRVKAGEYKSSGIVLLATGILGIAALVLLYLGMIPSLSGVRNNPLFMGVMSVLFILFVVIGFITYSKVQGILNAAEKDEALIEEIRNMMKESLTKEVIDKKAFPGQDISGMPDMDLYYGREEYMQATLKKAFPDADSALLEMMLDERYNQLYEDNDH